MPELPEVETIKIGLSRLLPGKRVQAVWHDWPKSFPNSLEDVGNFLIGATILDVKRRAKVLLIELDTKYSLVIHLKMTGQLVYVRKLESPANTDNSKQITDNDIPEERFAAGHPNDSLIGELPDNSTRVIFDLTGSPDRSISVQGQTFDADEAKLFFNDQRKFGWIRLLPTAEVPNIDFFRKVGPEPLSADFTAARFSDRLRRRMNTNIKAALLDQTVIAGVGNIYADESLWGARINPVTSVKDLTNSQMNTLFNALQTVLTLSIEKGGSTDKNYVDAEGKRGSYLSFANVFRREGQPCPRCGTTIIKTRVAGRGTHICPRCQK